MRQERSERAAERPAGPRPGRKRDHTRDGAILDAALEVLTEEGYDRMTMDTVARRAKAGKATMYRRWPSKEHLVLDAVTRMGQREVDLDHLPDTGTVRGDMMALISPETVADGERRLQVMAGLATLLTADPTGLAQAVHTASIEPWISVNRTLIQRGVDRGEVRGHVDIDTLARTIPSMAAYRVAMERKPIDADFLVTLINGIILPALGLPPEGTS
ncbi:TetR/AcrR family transcriptional regulator [Streptomyces cacaoi]|uniref:TetR/AcrR family transcriptional regulator n=1 Tax=Streptomyces cacaoi TaxID=1898 RepID=UPI0037494AB2